MPPKVPNSSRESADINRSERRRHEHDAITRRGRLSSGAIQAFDSTAHDLAIFLGHRIGVYRVL
jgi:hypothetical protein